MAKYIMFDLDGTIIDSGPGITKSVQYALKKRGIAVETLDSLHCYIGPPLRQSFMEYAGLSKADAEKAIADYREYFAPVGIYENVLYPGIVNSIEQLKSAGKTIIVATSKPAVYAKRILEYHGISNLFAFVSGSELDGKRSVKSELIQYALEEMQLADKSEIVMVGDRKYDIIGANEIGIASVGVLYGYGSRSELEKAGATWIADSTGQILEILL